MEPQRQITYKGDGDINKTKKGCLIFCKEDINKTKPRMLNILQWIYKQQNKGCLIFCKWDINNKTKVS